MYRVGQDNRMRKCLTTLETQIVLKELHKGMVGGHFDLYITTKKIMDARYWWPTLFKDICEFYKNYDNCKKTLEDSKQKNLAKLVTTFPKEPFLKWGLNFIGPIKPT
jgi:hypothetical protein